MSAPERFSVVSPLPAHGEWRRALALDRSGPRPHAVVLSFAPQALVDDPERLVTLIRDVEAAGRLHHPSAVAVLGTETVGDALAIVEAHRPGATLRDLLDAGGRLPPDVAARIALDVCEALSRAHALDVADGKKLVHGRIDPARVLVGEDGAALLLGFGIGGEAGPEDDVRALGAVLHECLAGAPPGKRPEPLEEVGASSALASAVRQALGATQRAPIGVAALGAAVAAAGPIASHADVAAYVEAILPADEGVRGEQARALASAIGGKPAPAPEEVEEDFIVEPTGPQERPVPGTAPESAGASSRRFSGPQARTVPEPTLEPLPRPPATRPGADPAGVFVAPPRPVARSHAPALVAAACLVVGFAAGFAAARMGVRVSIGLPPSAPRSAPPAAAAPVPAASAPAAPVAEPPAPAGSASKKAATKQRPGQAPARAAKTRGKAGSAAAAGGKGILHVNAPADAEVFLDDRRIGKGTLDVQVPEGAHRIEVRLGQSRVAERFSLAPGETWTYDVTPTQ